MLRDEAVAQHLDPLPRHLLDDGRIVQKPPATKRQKVAEFASVDTEFMLVLTAEDADEESIIRELNAKMLDGTKIRLSYAISGEFDGGVDLVTNADHHGKRNAAFSPGR